MKRSEIIAFAGLLLFALLPNILIVCMAEDLAGIGTRLLYILSTLVLYAVGLCVCHRRAYLYVVSLGFLLSAIELFHLFARHTTITALYLYTWLKTSPAERIDILLHYWWIGLIGVGLWLLFYVLAHSFVARKFIAPLRWRLVALAILLPAALLLPIRVCPVNVLHQFGKLAGFAITVERHLPEQRQFEYGITPNGSKAEETLILVIGETSYADWERIGYRDSLAIDFDSVYAECPVSGVAIPLMLTRATPAERDPFFVEKSVIRAFDEAGFYTAWLSNYGYHDHFLMRIADDCRYLSYQPGRPDIALLQPLREVLDQPSQRHMITLVTQGGRDSVNLAHTAGLLHQLTDSLRTIHMPAMVIYIGSNNISLTHAHSETHVPFMVWTNPNYRYRHRPLIRQLQAHRQWPISTSCLYHSLLHMWDIGCEQRNDRLAIGSDQLQQETLYYIDEDLQTQVLKIR